MQGIKAKCYVATTNVRMRLPSPHAAVSGTYKEDSNVIIIVPESASQMRGYEFS